MSLSSFSCSCAGTNEERIPIRREQHKFSMFVWGMQRKGIIASNMSTVWKTFLLGVSFCGFLHLSYCWGNSVVLIVLAKWEFSLLRLIFLCSSIVIVIKMITNVRSSKFNNLEWQQQKSWFKRLLVSHIESLYPSFVHRVWILCASCSIKFLFVFFFFFLLPDLTCHSSVKRYVKK